MTRQERITKILARVRQIAPDPLPRDNTVLDQSPAVKVINSVLSLRRVIEKSNRNSMLFRRTTLMSDRSPN